MLAVGVFHFSFPNLDARQVRSEEQIDVLDPKYQQEILALVDRLAAFRPTKIIIERMPAQQKRYDSLYASFLQGKHALRRNEEEQIGFRLARMMGHQKLYCVDEWGALYPALDSVFRSADTTELERFASFIQKNPDSSLKRSVPHVFQKEGVLAQLRLLNDPETVRASLGNYLVGGFKYEQKKGDFFGADFESSRWFNRNLRIFRNIQRVTEPGDRILVLFGADHMNLLQLFFSASPEYRLNDALPFLQGR